MSADPIVKSFSTRWELIVDFFNELQKNGCNCSIAPPDPDEFDLLEHMQEQGVNLRIERELYIFVVGMCNVAEVLWWSVQQGETPLDEFLSALSVVRGNLSVIRDFLPQEYFTRFFE